MNMKLAQAAEREALFDYHGNIDDEKENIDEIIAPFPKMDFSGWDGRWCAAFIYYCCCKAGIKIPPRPKECVSGTLAGCKAWEEFAISNKGIGYFLSGSGYEPETGNIVLFDRVFEEHEHDHIGIVLENHTDYIITAEGNYCNCSAVVKRNKDEHIRAYISIPEEFEH